MPRHRPSRRLCSCFNTNRSQPPDQHVDQVLIHKLILIGDIEDNYRFAYERSRKPLHELLSMAFFHNKYLVSPANVRVVDPGAGRGARTGGSRFVHLTRLKQRLRRWATPSIATADEQEFCAHVYFSAARISAFASALSHSAGPAKRPISRPWPSIRMVVGRPVTRSGPIERAVLSI
jgi:hypothetical protein